MSIFTKIKEEVDFLEGMEKYVGPLKECGENTYTTEDDLCPIHGGSGSFRIKYDGEDSFVKCFGSCSHEGWPLDLVGYVQLIKGFESPGMAAYQIAKDFGIELPKAEKTVQDEILAKCLSYYTNLFDFGIKKYSGLGRKTPLEYQLEVRGHKKETLSKLQVGWSDGSLLDALEDDFSEEDLLNSGMIKQFKDGDLTDTIPAESFVYPHFWNGRLSRFSFKHNPSKGKKLDFQVKKKYWLGDIEFYRVGRGNPVAIVEGENDLASLVDDGWDTTILCTNGSLSGSQRDWLSDHNMEYHTYWDGDKAGGLYTKSIWVDYYNDRIQNVSQYRLPEDSDLDEWLRDGNELRDLSTIEVPPREEVISTTISSKSSIVEQNGCYYKISLSKDGETEVLEQISDFIIRLLYVKVQGEERSRVARLIKFNGKKSKPVVIDSEAKVSVRHWRILVANAIDASFTGNEIDLSDMWSHIYETQKEAIVDVPGHVGDIDDGGWLFGNQYIDKDIDIKGDEDNIMWFDESKKSGIAPKSLMAALSNNSRSLDIPQVWRGEDTEEFLGDILKNLNYVLKDPGLVLTLVGWLRSCAYSMPMFYEAKVKFFPFLLLWGRHGRGKSTLANWMLSFYDMADRGTTTVGQLRSGVGIERKLSYYRGLPFCIDELRADRQASEYSKVWRGWYNRSSRVKGTRKDESVIQVPLNACLFFSGQDSFTDPAMRSRCVPIKFPSNAGDTTAYNWLEDQVDEFPTVGYHWIRESMSRNIEDVKEGISEFKNELKEYSPAGIPSRAIGNYAMAGYFALDMAEKHFPKFDYSQWIIRSMTADHVDSIDNDMVIHFWEGVSGLQIGDRPSVNGNHIMIKNDKMYVWYAEVFKVVNHSTRGESRESFSKGAVRDALVEEPSFVEATTIRLGPTNTARRCLVFDLKSPHVPQEMASVAETAESSF